MSAENGKVCCNCRHCYRREGKFGMGETYCEIDDHYIGYVEYFEHWCRRWAKEKESKE